MRGVSSIPDGVRAAIAELRRQLEGRFGSRFRRATLFGSYARGEEGSESDVDVLVIVDDLVHRERAFIFETGAEIWMDTGARLAPLALSTAEYADLERRELAIAEDIAREGIPV
jgi:predicted nucleotidyltransferase